MSDMVRRIDEMVDEILRVFDVDRPPVPIEIMLQRPREGMWDEIDLSEMSASFLNLRDQHAPRMSAARLLVRNIMRSEWGQQYNLNLQSSEDVQRFARSILIPRSLFDAASEEISLDPITVAMHFEVPTEDAEARLRDFGVALE